jgi:hypothetical protein
MRLKLAGETVTIPRRPTTIPSEAYPIWPVNLRIGNTNLRYSTAQPLARLVDSQTWVFFAWDGLPAEFSFDEAAGEVIEAPGRHIVREEGWVDVTDIVPGAEVAITIRHPTGGGSPVQIVVLSRAQALAFWQAPFAGKERFWLSSASLAFDENMVHVAARNSGDLTLEVFPRLPGNVGGFAEAGREGIFQRWKSTDQIEGTTPKVQVTADVPTGVPPPLRIGPKSRSVALEPVDEDFAHAATWTLRIPAEVNRPGLRTFLSVSYVGDVARLYTGTRLDNDNFYKGTPWELGLWRYTPQQLAAGLTLKILPLRKDVPVFIEDSAKPEFGADGLALRLVDVRILEERDTELIVRH